MKQAKKEWKEKDVVTQCIRCRNYFEYKQKTPNNKRNLCDDCKDQSKKDPAGIGPGAPTRATHREVARMLNIDSKAVRRAERQALLKLRQHPQLLELYGIWIREGSPIDALTGLPGEETGKKLLEYQLEVLGWWQTRDLLAEDKICEPEAKELLEWIRKFQEKIAETLNKI